jgi:carbamoyltransferase
MKERINRKVKFREVFRPFAPAMLADCASGYVEGRGPGQWPARFMLLVLPLRDEFARAAPAVDHFGTARIQTVGPDWNPLFHSLLSGFRDRSGLGCLLNTSFNLRGEPIVATPEHAISTFERSELDLLVIEDCVVSRR